MAEVGPGNDSWSIRRVIGEGAIRTKYQPVVDLASGDILGFEALTRGPEGSSLESPAALFAAARAENLVTELDRLCWSHALTSAQFGEEGQRTEREQDAGRTPHVRPNCLFINVEPDVVGLLEPRLIPPDGMRVVVELTERHLTSSPLTLLRFINQARALGYRISLDDVGAERASLALLPLIGPDIIKLDLRLIQAHPDDEIAEIANIVAAERERSGAQVLAEGIETAEQVQTALGLGATLGQGWFFGRVGDLGDFGVPSRSGSLLAPVRHRSFIPLGGGRTPYDIVETYRAPRTATWEQLLELTLHLAHEAIAAGDAGVVLAAVQRDAFLTPEIRQAYCQLADTAAFASLLGTDLFGNETPVLRRAKIDEYDALAQEWNLVILGPKFAAALVAREIDRSAGSRSTGELTDRFGYVLTHDRDMVVAAAGSMMGRAGAADDVIDPRVAIPVR